MKASKIPSSDVEDRGTDFAAGSNTWSAGNSGLASGTDLAANFGSVTGFGFDSMSVSGNCWVSRSAVGSGFVSTVGVGNGSGSGAVMDAEWDQTLVASPAGCCH
ncbi:hypothetical protein R3I94_008918 [Phoxinus phoxinus]